MKCPVIDMKDTGRKLKEMCEERGITVKNIQSFLQLASVQSVYDWYHGRTLPSVDNLLALSCLLSVSMESMLVIRGEEVVRYEFADENRGATKRLSYYYARYKSVAA